MTRRRAHRANPGWPPQVAVWRLAEDRGAYGRQAGWYILTTPDGEDEVIGLGGPWRTMKEAHAAAAKNGLPVVPLHGPMFRDNPPPYAWVITRDLWFEGGMRIPGLKSAVGVAGPRGARLEDVNRLSAGRIGKPFRLLDDDREVYYEGRYAGPDDDTLLAPLDDFGMPGAGCTIIQYRDGGKWTDL